MAPLNFATEEKSDAKPVWDKYVSVKKIPCLRHKHTKKASAAKKDQNQQKVTKMQAPCDNIADILLARATQPSPLVKAVVHRYLLAFRA